MWRYCNWSVILGLFTLVLSNPRKFKEGDSCKLPESGKTGRCVPYLKCNSSVSDVNNYHKSSTTCNGHSGLICCEYFKERVPKAAENTMATISATTTSFETTTATKIQNPVIEFGRKSKDKCVEYSKWLDPPNYLPGSGKKIPGKCGIYDEPKLSDRFAAPLEFPHMALLGYENKTFPTYKYSASIISEQYLLASAHCLQGSNGPIVAKVGSGDGSNAKIVEIGEIFYHPKYAYPQKYNDLALIRLKEPLTFTDYVRPACLEVENVANETAVESFFKRGDEKILKKNLPILNHSQCSEIYPRNFYLQSGIDENTMFCAGIFNDDENAECHDDAGGPLQILKEEPHCMYGIIGIASFGKYCSVVPDVYTRISPYIPWIEYKLWPDHEESPSTSNRSN